MPLEVQAQMQWPHNNVLRLLLLPLPLALMLLWPARAAKAGRPAMEVGGCMLLIEGVVTTFEVAGATVALAAPCHRTC